MHSLSFQLYIVILISSWLLISIATMDVQLTGHCGSKQGPKANNANVTAGRESGPVQGNNRTKKTRRGKRGKRRRRKKPKDEPPPYLPPEVVS